MKKIVTTILGASLLASALYAAGSQMPQNGMMNHSNMNKMTKEQIIHCNKIMTSTNQNDSWTPPKDILAELYPEGDDVNLH